MSTQYSLHVTNLRDIRWDSKLHSKLPDLYVVASLGESSKQTRVIKKNRLPTWDEVLTLSSDNGADLIIELKHKSTWKSDPCVGYASIRVDELLAMCTERATRTAPVFLRKKGSGAPAGTLHLCLETANLMSNAELDVKAINIDIGQLSKMGENASANSIGKLELNTESDLYKSIGTLFSNLDVFIRLIDDVSKIHPYLAVTWQVASLLYKGISNQIKADKKLVDLVRLAVEVFDFVHDTEALPDKCRSLEKAIINILKQTTECCFFVRHCVRHSFVGRLLNVGFSEKIDEFSSSFIEFKQELDSGIALHTAFVSARVKDKVDAIYLQQRLSLLDPDKVSAFNRPQCLPGTRTEIQKQIVEWMLSDTEQNVFWLFGAAGSGKSTISTTIAEHFRGLHRLGAFLFFERGKSDPASVIKTMAYGLAGAEPSIAKHIVTAIELDNDIASASAANQFEELIMKPLTASAMDLRGPILIVLDALDECGTFETRRTLIELFRREIHKLPLNARILITSRRETDIEEAFSAHPEYIRECELDYASGDSKRDVLEYIRFEMTRWVKDKVSVPADWPWEENMKLLAEAAAGLFIWASTAIKLVSLYRDNPFQKLKDLLSDLQSLTSFGLNELYTNVLFNSGISWDSITSRARFSQVIGLILLSKTPLSITTIDGILGFPPENSSKHILSGLQCLLVYSAEGPIHLFHASFSDYLMSHERSDDPWKIDIPVQMMYISSRCFVVMKDMLHFNMCSLESSFVSNDCVYGLEDRIGNSIPPHLAYACLHWSHHLCNASQSSLLLDELSDFVYSRLLYWFEVLSLLKKVGVGDTMLGDASQWTGSRVEGLSIFLTDARRLLTMFSFPISRCTPHIYMSMLPLTSKESPVAAHYSKEASLMATVERIGERDSTPLLRFFRLDVDTRFIISTIIISSDCTRVASSYRNGDIYIWDAESGEMILGPLKGHADDVNCLAFSPDGTRLVSGSDDRTIRSWNATSGERISEPFEGHLDWITSVVFSSDGNRLASGSLDRTVIVWDSWSGMIIFGPLRGHTDIVLAVDFSPDGTCVVSGSEDGTLFLWDVENGLAIFSSKGYTDGIVCVKFSPDGAHIISGSDDDTIIVWNVLTGKSVWETKKVHVYGAACINFSRDGSHIVSGGVDKAVRISTANGFDTTSTELTGHTEPIMAVTFSLDGTRIMSASQNGEIGVWDVVGAETASELIERRPSTVDFVAYTPDGSRIFSVYNDKVLLWDVQSGRTVSKSLHGIDGPKYCVALSPDFTRFAIDTSDGKIMICSTESGEAISVLLSGYTDPIYSINFSLDGTQLVSGSRDGAIIVWDAENGSILYGPFKRGQSIHSVTFSPDGACVLSGFEDGTIEVCDVESGDVLARTLQGHTQNVLFLIFSPCGTRFASAARDRTIVVWDYKSGQIVSTLFGHTAPVWSISFSPDGLRLASGSLDKTVMVWDVITGTRISGPFRGHSDYVNYIAFSPDGTSVVSGSQDGTIRIWNVMGNITSRIIHEQYGGVASDIPASSSHTDSSNWVLAEDGWVLGSRNELLVWIPPTLRGTLWCPQNIALFGGNFQTKLDFSNCAQGDRWQECIKS